jgi:Ras-related protein Rab-1A
MSVTIKHTFDYVMTGNCAVGKTRLMLKFTQSDRTLIEIAPTIGIDFSTTRFKKIIDGMTHDIFLRIWDTAGQERYRTLTSSYYKRAHGIIFVYDVTDQKSFDNVQSWLYDVQNALGHDCIKNKNLIFMLIGNKTDLVKDRVISYETGNKLAIANSMLFFESSALTGEHVDEIIINLASASLGIALNILHPKIEYVKDTSDHNKHHLTQYKSNRVKLYNDIIHKKPSSCCANTSSDLSDCDNTIYQINVNDDI